MRTRVRSNMLRCCVLLLGFFVFFNTQALADVVFLDDFEGVTGVTWPDSGVDVDPVASTGTWVITESNQEDVQVSTNITAAGGTNYLTLSRPTVMEIGAYFTSSVDTSVYVTVEFDIYFDSTTGNHAVGANFGLRYGGSLNTLNQFLYSLYSPVGFRVLDKNANILFSGTQFAADEWHHAKFDFNLTTDTYDLTVDSLTSSNLTFFAETDIASWFWISGSAAHADANFFLDNMEVSVSPVPVPVTIVLLGVGGLLLFLLRRTLEFVKEL